MKKLIAYLSLILTWIVAVISLGFTFGFTMSLLKWASQLGGSLL